jgi:hypothetical protein
MHAISYRPVNHPRTAAFAGAPSLPDSFRLPLRRGNGFETKRIDSSPLPHSFSFNLTPIPVLARKRIGVRHEEVGG